jgi:putative membrane protein
MMICSVALALAVAKASPVDSLYLKTVAEDNVAELRLVKMVISKTKDRQVKKACQTMIDDHTKQYSQVKTLARSLDVEIPTQPSALHDALYKHLSKKSGKELDKSFTAAQLEDHINDVNEAQDESEIGNDPKLRDFAKNAVKTFAKHEHIWRTVAQHVGVEPTFGRPTAEQILAGKKVSD